MTQVSVVSRDGESAVFLGMSHRILVQGDQTGGAIGAVEITISPGAGVPPHTNVREALAWYVTEGTLTFHLEDGPVQLHRGSLVYLPRGGRHTFVNETDQPVTALMVCAPGGFEGLFVELAARLPAEQPAGPLPVAALEGMAEVAERYGMRLWRAGHCVLARYPQVMRDQGLRAPRASRRGDAVRSRRWRARRRAPA